MARAVVGSLPSRRSIRSLRFFSMPSRRRSISRIGAARFQLGDVLFQPRDGAGGFGFAARGLRLVGRVRIELVERTLQRGGGMSAPPSRPDRRGRRARSMRCSRLRAVPSASLRALAQASGDGFQIVGERGDLGRRLRGALRELVGKARQAGVQALHRVLHAVLRIGALDAVEPVGEAHDMGAELVEGLRLLARDDVHLGRGLAHGAIAFGLGALGEFHAPRDAAQLLLDAAIDVLELLARCARRARAPRSSHGRERRRRILGGVGPAGGQAVAGQFVLIPGVGEAAQDAPRKPLADRQALAPRRCACRFARFGRYACHVPRKIRPHFESLDDVPSSISTDGKI